MRKKKILSYAKKGIILQDFHRHAMESTAATNLHYLIPRKIMYTRSQKHDMSVENYKMYPQSYEIF